ncbi:hypothetical protein DFJ74DRAFT_775036 [Hyaloraphidium curvatum]|nr:hypothetical protein DFJ74DRAFT_775036 [Hyaloraphidium curvatum]
MPPRVTVRAVLLPPSPPSPDALFPILSPAERTRLPHLASPARHLEHAAARALARLMLAPVLRTRPADVPISVGDDGRPFVALPGPAPSFSLSHAAGMAAAAASPSPSLPLGLDVEPLSRHIPPRVLRKLTERERGYLASLPPGEREAGFARIWTAKEAFAKASRRGITSVLRGGLGADPVSDRLEFPTGDPDADRAWFVGRGVVAGTHAAAVVVGGGEGADLLWEGAVRLEELVEEVKRAVGS